MNVPANTTVGLLGMHEDDLTAYQINESHQLKSKYLRDQAKRSTPSHPSPPEKESEDLRQSSGIQNFTLQFSVKMCPIHGVLVLYRQVT
jgi:hypothetical protein